jgi:hypothetical protein
MCHHMPQATYPDPVRAAPSDPYLVLLRVGFAVPFSVATDAVRSYRTVSPLPAHFTFNCDACLSGGLFSVALSVNDA